MSSSHVATVVIVIVALVLLAVSAGFNIFRVRRLAAARQPIPKGIRVAFFCYGIAAVLGVAVIGLATIPA